MKLKDLNIDFDALFNSIAERFGVERYSKEYNELLMEILAEIRAGKAYIRVTDEDGNIRSLTQI